MGGCGSLREAEGFEAVTWSTAPIPDPDFSADPLAALEAFRKACEKPA